MELSPHPGLRMNFTRLIYSIVLISVLFFAPDSRHSTAIANEKGDGVKLDQKIEEKLKWGQPVKGLRAAVIIRPDAGNPKTRELPELFLAIQNGSDAPIQLSDTLAEHQPRMLYIKTYGKIAAGIGAKDPRLGAVMLKPREVLLTGE